MKGFIGRISGVYSIWEKIEIISVGMGRNKGRFRRRVWSIRKVLIVKIRYFVGINIFNYLWYIFNLVNVNF